MYTNISGEKAITALLDVLEREEYILEAERIWKESLTRLINLTVSTTYFTSNGDIYSQMFGLPMEPPLSPLLDRLEEFEKLPLQPRVLMRYLDDYFALWLHGKKNFDEFPNFLNKLDGRWRRINDYSSWILRSFART
ncbi:unnamed protein product [Protopolystoma xenopodis]|uniref:Reverse transcriptase domain-containing protein n=1 Tax=Protopolystoma xenopodis TaxID=117903 RepID=A0A448XB30_9PLAT|nr:unnamed protein product [Protopolystoma xenopodis]